MDVSERQGHLTVAMVGLTDLAIELRFDNIPCSSLGHRIVEWRHRHQQHDVAWSTEFTQSTSTWTTRPDQKTNSSFARNSPASNFHVTVKW